MIEPAEQPAQLGPENALILQSREERLDRVEHDTTGADRVDRVAEPDEEPLEIVVAGLLDLAALDADVVEDDFLVLDQSRKIEAQGGDVLRQLIRAFLEAHEHARLVESSRAMNEEADSEQSFAAPGSATHERGSTRWQSAAGNFVETFNAGRSFGQLRHREMIHPDASIGYRVFT